MPDSRWSWDSDDYERHQHTFHLLDNIALRNTWLEFLHAVGAQTLPTSLADVSNDAALFDIFSRELVMLLLTRAQQTET